MRNIGKRNYIKFDDMKSKYAFRVECGVRLDDHNMRAQAFIPAIKAFGVLAYRIGSSYCDEHLSELVDNTTLSDDDVVAALTVDAKLNSIGYGLTPSGIVNMAHLIALIRADGNLSNADIDPVKEVASAYGIATNNRYRCMYPGFPNEVLEMDEARFRFEQALHYFSTYGVERSYDNIMASAEMLDGDLKSVGDGFLKILQGFGIDAKLDNGSLTVLKGWMPASYDDACDNYGAVQSKSATSMQNKNSHITKFLDVVLMEDELRSMAFNAYASNKRVGEDVLDVIAACIADPSCDSCIVPSPGFKENAIMCAMRAICNDLPIDKVLRICTTNPMDVAKLTLALTTGGAVNGSGDCNVMKTVKLPTRIKRGICKRFADFDAMSIADSLVEAKHAVKRALAFISPASYIKDEKILKAIREPEKMSKSYASRLEQAYAALNNAIASMNEPYEKIREKILMASQNDSDNDSLVESILSESDSLQSEHSDGKAADLVEKHSHLVELAKNRPGNMLRSIVRLASTSDAVSAALRKAGYEEEARDVDNVMDAAFADASNDMSLVSLVQAATVMTSKKIPYGFARYVEQNAHKFFTRGVAVSSLDIDSPHLLSTAFDKNDFTRLSDAKTYVKKRCEIAKRFVIPCISAKIEHDGGRECLNGMKVFVDWQGYDDVRSILAPNAAALGSASSFPMPGMAISSNADGIVRHFVFWNDKTDRVDIDLHASGDTDKRGFTIGWDSDFRGNGLVTSGDITTSINSAEYIDIDTSMARSDNVLHVSSVIDIFCGANGFNDIEDCRAGVLLIDGDFDAQKSNNRELYEPSQCLISDDLTSLDSNRIRYADIAILPNSGYSIRFVKGANAIPNYCNGIYTLDCYIDDLLDGCKAIRTDNRDDADIVLCVGHKTDDDSISLYDNGYFLLGM